MSLPVAERNSRFQYALKLCNDGQSDQARALLQQLVRDAPDFAPAYTELGLLCERRGDLKEAAFNLRRAVEVSRLDVNCLWALADFCRRRNEWQKAHECFSHAVRQAPSNAALLKGLLSTQKALQDHEGMLQTAERILDLEPANIAASVVRGEALEALEDWQGALVQFEALIGLSGAPPFVTERWANLMIRLDRAEELIGWIEERLARSPLDTHLLLLLSFACVAVGTPFAAMEALEKALQAQPDNLRVMCHFGVISGSVGKFDESRKWLSRLLQHDPRHIVALRLFGDLHKYEHGDEALTRLTSALAEAERADLGERAQLFYALGKAYDDIGDYAAAFRYYKEGGKMHLGTHSPMNESPDEWFGDYVRQMDGMFSRDMFDIPAERGYEDQRPVFVLGMPRSGTSLVEQILSSHPDVFGAGEVSYLDRALDGISVDGETLRIGMENPFFGEGLKTNYEKRGEKYVEALSSFAPRDALRIVDKMPQNFRRVGFIKLILPKAKIIHCRRHLVETCLSIFRTFFAEGHLYSFDLKELGKYYRRYDEMMSVWYSKLPPECIFNVRYEDVVLNFENQVRRLIHFVGLEWNDKCLDFHMNPRAVHTASATQVRKPLYKTSINRWRKYEPYIQPLLDELGPLVRQYESELEVNAT